MITKYKTFEHLDIDPYDEENWGTDELKEGDIVTCINSAYGQPYLKIGQKYTIKYLDDRNFVKLENIPKWFDKKRFVKYSDN